MSLTLTLGTQLHNGRLGPYKKCPRYSFFDGNNFFKDYFEKCRCLKMQRTSIRSLLNLLQYSFCFMIWLFDCMECGILAC